MGTQPPSDNFNGSMVVAVAVLSIDAAVGEAETQYFNGSATGLATQRTTPGDPKQHGFGGARRRRSQSRAC